MNLLWHIIKPETQAAIRRYMPPGWAPPLQKTTKVATDLKLESPAEIGILMSKPPASKKELEAE
jgi:hypothetical protein